MIGFAAERLMEPEVGAATGAVYGEKGPARLARRSGYLDRDWVDEGQKTVRGTVFSTIGQSFSRPNMISVRYGVCSGACHT